MAGLRLNVITQNCVVGPVSRLIGYDPKSMQLFGTHALELLPLIFFLFYFYLLTHAHYYQAGFQFSPESNYPLHTIAISH